MTNKLRPILVAGILSLFLISCDKEDEEEKPMIIKPAYAVSESNGLLIFDPESKADIIRTAVAGMQAGENILGIDVRPANGMLYAIGSNSRIYTINTSTGAATFVAALSIPLNGSSFAVDFNPVPDRIRIISNTGQNLRVNPADGATTNDGAINPTPAAITAAAYTNSVAGATTTTLHVIDTDADKIFIQNPPNNGTLTMGMNLGVNADAANGFDIGGRNGVAYALLSTGNSTSLYTINLSTGQASEVRTFGEKVRGLALGTD
ncbi:MAG TPA: DUF4394 domain-containing protein, partial [Flavisolibacter sp.]